MAITATSFYWHKDTPSFVTWRSRLATAPDTPTCIIKDGGQFTGGVHPPNQFVPEIVSPLPCSPALVRHTLLFVDFFKELISFIGSLDICHTSVFNALIMFCTLQTELNEFGPRNSNINMCTCPNNDLDTPLTLSQRSPGFYVSAVQVF